MLLLLPKLALTFLFLFLSSCQPGKDPYLRFTAETPQAVIDECMKENPGFSASDCDLKNCFSNELVLRGMQKLLADMHAAFTETNIRYWIEGGALVGAIRFNTFLPWDDDIDVDALASDFEANFEAFRNAIIKRGYRLDALWADFRTAGDGLFGGPSPMWQISFTPDSWRQYLLSVDPALTPKDLQRLVYQYELHGNAPHYEVVLWDQNADKLVPRSYALQKLAKNGSVLRDYAIPKDNSPQPTINFLGGTYPVPADITQYLKTWYSAANLVTDIVMNAAAHTGRCTQKIRFRDVRNNRPVLNYLKSYLKSVFDGQFTDFAPELQEPAPSP
jgi:hypothetical protein